MNLPIDPAVREPMTPVDRLSTLPGVYMKVLSALDDPDVSIAEVADVIATDLSLTHALLRVARLQLANSTFYGYARRIESIQHAVSLVGLEKVRGLVLETSVHAIFARTRSQRPDTARVRRDLVRRGMLASELARTFRAPRQAAIAPK